MITKNLLNLIEKIQLVYSNVYYYLFNRVNKNIILKLRFFSFFQIIIVKLNNRILRKFQSISDQPLKRDYITRDKQIFHYTQDILTYLMKHKVNFRKFLEGLDKESKELIKIIIERLKYIYTHGLINKRKLLTSEELRNFKKIQQFTKRYKQNIILPLDVFDSAVFYYKCGLIFLPQKVINNLKGIDFIDGGAYIGDSAIIFEKEYKPIRIFSFEPEFENYEFLLKTIKLNNLKKTIAINKALGDKEEILKIDSKGISSHISKKGNQITEVVSIDNYVQSHDISIGLIKLDVEGFGLKVLKGARNTIQKDKPVLLIAIYHNGEEFFEIKKYISLHFPGYKFIIRKLQPLALFLETMLIAWFDEDQR